MTKKEKEKYENLIEAASSAVVGYEKYLMDELSSLELAKIMKLLQSLLPSGVTCDKKD
jgi:hypothetical protein|tara:strand:- start:260 stop:433 length:174 start_codon:yes stop_codon:yes gene_type:complete